MSRAQKIRTGQKRQGLDREFLRLRVRERCDPYNDPIPEIPDGTLVEFSGRCIRLFEQVTGLSFEADAADQPVLDRVRENLQGYMGRGGSFALTNNIPSFPPSRE